jgi:hypothetical protein
MTNIYYNDNAHLKSVFVSFGTGPFKSNLSGKNSSALSQTLQNQIYTVDQNSDLLSFKQKGKML